MVSLREIGVDAAIACVLLLVFSGNVRGSYCWDHQQETYNTTFAPKTCSGSSCTVTPFFSPGTSLQAYVQLIDSAQESIDIYTPSKWH